MKFANVTSVWSIECLISYGHILNDKFKPAPWPEPSDTCVRCKSCKTLFTRLGHERNDINHYYYNDSSLIGLSCKEIIIKNLVK